MNRNRQFLSAESWERRIIRRMQLLRGRIACLRGARAGIRFGLGPAVRILYPHCLTVEDDVTIEGTAYLHCLSERGVYIGSHTSIGPYLWLHCGGTEEGYDQGYFEIGRHSFIGANAVLGAGGGIHIGNHVLVGQCVNIHAENHNFADRSRTIREQGVVRAEVVIEDDVWIGSKATVLAGVRVGRGAVIGAGAVATRSVPPYAVVVGIPARILRYRGEGNS